MSADGEYVNNPGVDVGKTVRIAARGLTPNQTWFDTAVSVRGIEGYLDWFTHDGESTTIHLVVDDRDVRVTVPHLEVIEVTHL